MADETTKKSGGPQSNENAVDPKIDAIKQLIFGDNMVEYDERFDQLLDQIQKTKAELESKLDKQNQNLKDELSSLKSEIEKSISSLEKSTSKEMARLEDSKTNRKALGKMLQTIGDKLMQ